VVRGGFGKKGNIAKIVSDTWRMTRNPYTFVLKLTMLDDPQQKVGELILSITSCHSIIVLENTLN
jgi:hypothetical protein